MLSDVKWKAIPFNAYFASNFQEDFMKFEVKKASAGEDFDLKLEESFPELSVSHGVHVRGKKSLESKKHGNKNKREKARRIYSSATGYAWFGNVVNKHSLRKRKYHWMADLQFLMKKNLSLFVCCKAAESKPVKLWTNQSVKLYSMASVFYTTI